MWITTGSKISCLHKINLYLLSRDSNLKNYYEPYCKILTKVIKEVKRTVHYNQTLNSTNKTKTTWNIIKSEMDRNDQNSHDGDVTISELFLIPFITISYQ
jgi:hypothetical protein